MNILDIAIAKKLAGGGGGSGTDNYNDLSNLPKINDTTLSGNKSSSALGLQSEINSDSKLASDLVDDTNQDNKFVTSTEKNTWNAKQNAIDSDHKLSSDLVDDANKTNKFVTSTEKNTWNAKQNAIDSDHKLSSSLVSFTEAEAAALASGIDSSKVGQISTNQTNILYTLNRTGKNLAQELPTQTVNGVKLTNNGDGTYTITRTAQGIGSTSFVFGSNEDGKFDGYILTGGAVGYGLKAKTSLDDQTAVVSSTDWTTPRTIPSTARGVISVVVDQGENPQNVVIRPFICDAEMYDKDSSFTKPALPNSDLTRLEAEDRAALAEEIDAGAKNKLKNNSYTCTGSQGRYGRDDSLSIPAGDYVLIAKVNQTQNSALTLVWDGNQHDFNAGGSLSNTVKTWNVHATNTITSAWVYFNGTNDSWTDVMLCTKAAFGVSNKFVPYRVPINGVFWAEKYEARSTTLVSTGIKFTASKQTIYRITATAQYGNSKPTQLVIKKKLIPSESEGNFVVVSSDTNSQSLTATGIMTLGVGGYFEVYAAYDGTTSNRVYAIVEEVVL